MRNSKEPMKPERATKTKLHKANVARKMWGCTLYVRSVNMSCLDLLTGQRSIPLNGHLISQLALRPPHEIP